MTDVIKLTEKERKEKEIDPQGVFFFTQLTLCGGGEAWNIIA